MVLRQEQKADFPAIYDLVKTAFQTAKVSNGDEQNFVDRLRASGNYLPELALVAEDQCMLIGHIMLTRTFFETASGRRPILLLGPLAVVFERRGQGIGAQLVHEACRLAKDNRGHTAVILVGDPAYYSRFGFRPAIHFGIANTDQIPNENVMAYELVPGALRDIQGTISFHG